MNSASSRHSVSLKNLRIWCDDVVNLDDAIDLDDASINIPKNVDEMDWYLSRKVKTGTMQEIATAPIFCNINSLSLV